MDDKALEMPMWMKFMTWLIIMAGARWPADKGSWTSLYCVASPEMKAENSGVYFERIAKAGGMQSAKSNDMKLAEKLEDWTRKEMKAKGFV